jgi:uncharacterized protein with NRDE domain
MCLILLAIDAHPKYRLILAANRDEFLARPTAPAAFWEDAPQVLAGRDLQGGGTWLGITTTGRLAALTNFRDLRSRRPHAPSRGNLVSAYLRGTMSVAAYRDYLEREGSTYNDFNLLFGDPHTLNWFSNRGNRHSLLAPGVHGLSNEFLDSPWPKVNFGRQGLERLAGSGGAIRPEELFAILADRTIAPDHLLPDTGVGIERERALSPLFIATPSYGTRSSTVILVDRESRVTFSEQTFDGTPEEPRTVTWQFTLAPSPHNH